MPIYDYQCNHCQAAFEVRASFQEKALGLKPACPNCQSTETRQVLTAGLILHRGDRDGATRQSFSCNPNTGSGCCSR